jgi:hypothetical protein
MESHASLGARRRLEFLADRTIFTKDDRMWWFKTPGHAYLPLPYSILSDSEWEVMREWFLDTERIGGAGEINIPFMSMVIGLCYGNCIDRIVQLGHYRGYSTLLLGFILRYMGRPRSLVTIDIDQGCCEYTSSFVEKADLSDYVMVLQGDSSDPHLPAASTSYLGGRPKLVIVDSSHQYKHTLTELNLWFPALVEDGFIFMHDSSYYAVEFDVTKMGGVKRALEEWAANRNDVNWINIFNSARDLNEVAQCCYQDGCGLAIVQKASYKRTGFNAKYAAES